LDTVELSAYGEIKRGSLQDIVDRQKIEIENSDYKPKSRYEKKDKERQNTNLEKQESQDKPIQEKPVVQEKINVKSTQETQTTE
jgi:hypothetical protein